MNSISATVESNSQCYSAILLYAYASTGGFLEPFFFDTYNELLHR